MPLGWLVTCKLAAIAVALQHPPSPRTWPTFATTLPTPAPLHQEAPAHSAEARGAGGGGGRLPHQTGRLPVMRDRRLPPQWASTAPVGFQKGVILKLLGPGSPYASGTCASCAWGTITSQDPSTGHWHLHLSGSDLKVGMRGAQPHDLPRGSHGVLPRLPARRSTVAHGCSAPGCLAPRRPPYVFLTVRGSPFTYADPGRGTQRRGSHAHRPSSSIRTSFGPSGLQNFLRERRTLPWPPPCWATDRHGHAHPTMDIVNKDQHAKAKAFLGAASTARADRGAGRVASGVCIGRRY